MERSENNSQVGEKKSYQDLHNDERLYAILGAVKEPVSRDLALKLSDIDYQSLEDKEKERIDAVFEREGIEVTEAEGDKRYQLGMESQETLNRTIDVTSVHQHIGENRMKDLGFEL